MEPASPSAYVSASLSLCVTIINLKKKKDLGSCLKELWLLHLWGPCWLLAGSCPQFLVKRAAPQNSSQHSSCCIKTSKRESFSTTEVRILQNIFTEVTSLHLSHIPLVRGSHTSNLQAKRWAGTGGGVGIWDIQGVGIWDIQSTTLPFTGLITWS